jgi:hypothetical protein
MKRYLVLSLIGSTLLGLYACSGNNSTPPLTGAFRLVNGVSDSNGMSASATSGFPSSGNVDFDAAGSVTDVPDGGYNVQVTPGAGNQFTVDNVGIQHNNQSTLFTYGSALAGTAKGFVAEENLSAPSTSGDFTLQFVNDTSQPTTAALSIYLVPAGSSIASVQPLATANAASASSDISVPAGTYEIIITNGTTTVYDSGSTEPGIVLPTPDTNVIQIGALDATATQAEPPAAGPGSYGSLITLIVMDNNGGQTMHYNGQN